MKKILMLFILINGLLSCNEKKDSKAILELTKKLSNLTTKNDSLKSELKDYGVQLKENIKLFLTNDSIKYWIINSINEQNIENAQNRIIWKFDNENNYYTYTENKGSLTQNENEDERYNNTFEIVSRNQVLLNGYKRNIKRISMNALEIENGNRIYVLTPWK